MWDFAIDVGEGNSAVPLLLKDINEKVSAIAIRSHQCFQMQFWCSLGKPSAKHQQELRLFRLDPQVVLRRLRRQSQLQYDIFSDQFDGHLGWKPTDLL
jgi:hypothetical protein